MTGDAIPLRDRAEFYPRTRGLVTLLAFGIIRRDVLRQASVRIVACRAGNPLVRRIIATAIRETVELKPNIENPARPVGRNIGPARMTLAAHVREFLRLHCGQLRHGRSGGVSTSHRGDMLRGAGVALGALDTGRQGLQN